MEICCESWPILGEGLIGLGSIGKFEGIPNLFIEPFGVLENTREAGHVSTTDVDDVLDTIVASVNWSHTAQGTGVEAILDTLSTMRHSFSDIAHGG